MDRFLAPKQNHSAASAPLSAEELARRDKKDADDKAAREFERLAKIKLRTDLLLAREKWHLSDVEMPAAGWGRPSINFAWCKFLIRWLAVFLSNGGLIDALPAYPGSQDGRPKIPDDFDMSRHYVHQAHEMKFNDDSFTWLIDAFSRYPKCGTLLL